MFVNLTLKKNGRCRHNCYKDNDTYQKISGRCLFILGNFIIEVKIVLYIYVGFAGIIGALLRYFIGVYFNQWWFNDFPLATFLTNMAGSFILGWFTTFLPRLKFIHPYMATALGLHIIYLDLIRRNIAEGFLKYLRMTFGQISYFYLIRCYS
jgi:hypothetical protein